MRGSAFDPVAIPSAFWARADVCDALRERDVGAFLRLLRKWTGLSQTRIATATGIAQGRLSEYFRDKRAVTAMKVWERFADGLDMPDSARSCLGIAPRHGDVASTDPPTRAATPGDVPAPPTAQPVPGATYPAAVDDALTALTDLWRADAGEARALVLATADVGAWNAAALAWLVSPTDTSSPEPHRDRGVGRADVRRVRETADLFACLDNRFGGAHSRRALVQYLRSEGSELLTGKYTSDIGRDLFSAVAEATLLAAWMSYDCGLHGLAQRYFVQALRIAQAGDARQLAASVLSAMSHQATFLGHSAEAVNLARAALTGVTAVATPALTAQFHAMEARAFARLGDARACQTALTAAERSFGRDNPADEPEFIRYFNEAELAAELGHCFRDLRKPRPATQHAAHAVDSGDGQYRRSDFFATMVLAHGLADQDEPEQACATALKALQIGETLTSARCIAYLQDFRDRLARLGDSRIAHDFQEQAAAFDLWAKTA